MTMRRWSVAPFAVENHADEQHQDIGVDQKMDDATNYRENHVATVSSAHNKMPPLSVGA